MFAIILTACAQHHSPHECQRTHRMPIHAVSETDEGQMWKSCDHHKTWKTYGDVAKVITPGLFMALQQYRRLPRPNGCKTFLVPFSSDAGTVYLPGCLHQFNKRHLKHAKVSPTSNQVRKKWHEVLIGLTETREKAEEVMVLLDTHSLNTMRKFYLMRDPEKQVKLGQLLIDVVIGKTVEFPTMSQAQWRLAGNQEWAMWVQKVLDPKRCLHMGAACPSQGLDEVCGPDDGVDDDELRSWQFGHWFGILDPSKHDLLPVGDVTDEEVCAIMDKEENRVRGEDPAPAWMPQQPGLLPLTGPGGSTASEAATQPPAPAKKEKKRKPISPEKLAIWDQYAPPPANSSFRKIKVDPECHKMMLGMLIDWQKENATSAWELPFGNEWYFDRRVELIQKGRLPREANQTIVRTFLRDKVKSYYPSQVQEVAKQRKRTHDEHSAPHRFASKFRR